MRQEDSTVVIIQFLKSEINRYERKANKIKHDVIDNKHLKHQQWHPQQEEE